MASWTPNNTSASHHQLVHVGNRHGEQQDSRFRRRGQAPTFSDATVFETPIMTMHQATSYINACLESSALSYTEKTTVGLVIQDAEGTILQQYSGNFAIDIDTTLKDFIVKAQAKIDRHISPGEGKQIITELHMIIDELMAGMPSIKGERTFEAHRGTAVQQIEWKVDGETEHFYNACKILLLQIGDRSDVTRPYFRVTTANEIYVEGVNFKHHCHTFYNDASNDELRILQPRTKNGACHPIRNDFQSGVESLTLDSSMNATIVPRDINNGPNLLDIQTPEIPLATIVMNSIALNQIPLSDANLPVFLGDDNPHFPEYVRSKPTGVGDTEDVFGENLVMLPCIDFMDFTNERILRSAASEDDAREAAIGFDSDDDEAFLNMDPQPKKSSSNPKLPITVYRAHRLSMSEDTGTCVEERPPIAGARPAIKQKTSVEEIQAFNIGLYGSAFGATSDSAYLNALTAAATQSVSPFAYTITTAASQQRVSATAVSSGSVQSLSASVSVTHSNHSSASANGPFDLVPDSCRFPSSKDSWNQHLGTKTDAKALVTAFPLLNIESSLDCVQGSIRSAPCHGSSCHTLPNENAPHSHYFYHTPTNAATPTPIVVRASPNVTISDQQSGTCMPVSVTSASSNARKQDASFRLRAETPDFKCSGTNAGTSQTYHAPGTTSRSRTYVSRHGIETSRLPTWSGGG